MTLSVAYFSGLEKFSRVLVENYYFTIIENMYASYRKEIL